MDRCQLFLLARTCNRLCTYVKIINVCYIYIQPAFTTWQTIRDSINRYLMCAFFPLFQIFNIITDLFFCLTRFKKNGPSWTVVMIKWQLDLKLPMQSVPITTNVVGSHPAHGKVYSIQLYMIHVFSDLRQDDGFLRVPRSLQAIKLTDMMIQLKYY